MQEEAKKNGGLSGIENMLERIALPFSSKLYGGNPEAKTLVPIHPFVPTGVISLALSVLHVLSESSQPKITFPIVECLVDILVVYFLFISISNSHDESVHRERPNSPIGVSNRAIGVKASFIFLPQGVPFELIYSFKVFFIDKGNLSLRQRDFTVGLFKGCHRSLRSGVLSFAGASTPTPQF